MNSSQGIPSADRSGVLGEHRSPRDRSIILSECSVGFLSLSIFLSRSRPGISRFADIHGRILGAAFPALGRPPSGPIRGILCCVMSISPVVHGTRSRAFVRRAFIPLAAYRDCRYLHRGSPIWPAPAVLAAGPVPSSNLQIVADHGDLVAAPRPVADDIDVLDRAVSLPSSIRYPFST